MELSAQPGVLYPRWYDAQVAIVGSMLIDPRCVGEVLSLVSAEDFRYESFAKIFRVIRDMFNGGVVIDPVTVQDRLDEDCMQIMAEAMRITPTAPQRSTSAPAPSVRNANRAGPPVAETSVAVAASPITSSVFGSDASTCALCTSPSTSRTFFPVAAASCPPARSPYG